MFQLVHIAVALFVLALPARFNYATAVVLGTLFAVTIVGIATSHFVEALVDSPSGKQWAASAEAASIVIGTLLIAGTPVWLATSRWRRTNRLDEPLIPPGWRAQRKVEFIIGLGLISLGNLAFLAGISFAAYYRLDPSEMWWIVWYFIVGAIPYLLGILAVEMFIRAWTSTHAT